MKTRFLISLVLILGAFALRLQSEPVHAGVLLPTPAAPAEKGGDRDDRTWPAMIAAVDEATAATTDHFGYTRSAAAYDWRELHGQVGVTQVFTDTDNDFQGPYDLGFDFPFYENTYREIYINSNGMVSFGGGSNSRSNVPIPQNPIPNNYIAPLWANLTLGPSYDNPDGVVYYHADAGAGYAVVEWYRVGILGVEDVVLTFEVILYDTGNIAFQYQTLTLPPGYAAENSVGMEDMDGVDGLLAFYNALPAAGDAVLFTRPEKASRLKALPLLQGKFADGGQADFQVSLRNTGDDPAKLSDVFNLSAATSQTGWSTSFWSADGATALGDSDADGRPDTGSLAQGDTFTLTVRVQAAQAGAVSYGAITFTAQSKNEASKTATSQIQVALPAPFAQAYADNSLHIGLYDERATVIANVDSSFPGSNMSLSLLRQNYAFTWEINQSKQVGSQFVLHTNVQYALFDPGGGLVFPSSYLTDNNALDVSTRDRSPMMVATPDGTIGAIWYREIFDPAQGTNDNIYFSRLLANGQPVAGSQVNVTGNTSWRATNTLDVPYFYSPRIAATADNRFILAWSDEKLSAQGTLSNIWYAVYASDGTQVLGPTALTASTPNQSLYSYPALAVLRDNRTFIAYTLFDDVGKSYAIAFAVLDSGGQVQKAQTSLADAAGTRADVVQLAGGAVMLAWTDIERGQIAYAILDSASFTPMTAPTLVTNPDLIPRPADYVSITRGRGGSAILTWMDNRWNAHLYYAEVGVDGSFATEPMIFLTTVNASTLLQTSFTGYGNALRPRFTYLPLILR
ncbi:MAG: hypothetical protein ACOYYS_02335 [Chloroflexota bacterium]